MIQAELPSQSELGALVRTQYALTHSTSQSLSKAKVSHIIRTSTIIFNSGWSLKYTLLGMSCYGIAP